MKPSTLAVLITACLIPWICYGTAHTMDPILTGAFQLPIALSYSYVDVSTLQRLDDGNTKLPPPVWPLKWNATLIKIGNETNPQNIQWTKFYYDWTASPGGSSRFDFYPGYLPLNLDWAPNFIILFTNFSIYHIFPLEGKCDIRSCDLPSINPKWLQSTTYHGTFMFRGMPADLFLFGPELDYIQYWQRHSDQLPMRSTNQANDPGATDYVDVVLGHQDPALWRIPSYCPPCNR